VRNAPDSSRVWRSAASEGLEGQWARLTFPVPVWVREVRLYNQRPRSGRRPTDAAIEEAVVRLFADEAGTVEVGRGTVGRLSVDATSLSFVGGTQPDGVRVVHVDVIRATGRVYGRRAVSLGEVEVISRGDSPPGGRIVAAPALSTGEPEKLSGSEYYDTEGASSTTADGGRHALAGCPPSGPLSHTFGGDRPLPVRSDPAVFVRMAAMVVGRDGALRLDPSFSAPRPEYSVVLEGVCGTAPCSWTFLAVDRDLPRQSNLLTQVRAGDTPDPDETWGPWIRNGPSQASPFDPPLRGRYLQIDFTLIAANRKMGAGLWGFRACYAADDEGEETPR
jgi:hypothetical protein